MFSKSHRICCKITLILISRCFPHIVNLACHAVLGAITKLEFAAEDAVDFVPSSEAPATLEEALNRDPIATTRSLIRGVSVCFYLLAY